MSVDLNVLLGPAVIGSTLSSFTSGINTLQYFIYLTSPNNDSKFLQLIVAFVYLLTLIHSACVSANIWIPSVTFYGDLTAVANASWAFSLQPIITGAVSFVVQLYYAHRVYKFSGSAGRQKDIIIPIIIGSLAFVSTVFSISCTVLAFSWVQYERFIDYSYGICLWLGISAGLDIIITCSLFYYLRQFQKETKLAATASMVDQIIKQTISNGLLTATVAMIALIIFLSLDQTEIHGIFVAILPKIYLSSLLACLNGRKAIKETLLKDQEEKKSKYTRTKISNIQFTTQRSTAIAEEDDDVLATCISKISNKSLRGLKYPDSAKLPINPTTFEAPWMLKSE